MELQYVKLFSALGLLMVTFFFSMLPLFWFKKYRHMEDERRQDNFRVISFFSCFGGGVFLGTCLLHLFPDVQEQMDLVFKGLNIVPNYPVSEFLFGFGFLMILIVEQIAHNCREHGHNEQVSTLSEAPSTNDMSRPLIQDTGTQYGTIEVNHDSHNHEVAFVQSHTSSSILRYLLLAFALSLHSIFEGLAIGLQTTAQSDFRILIAVLIHKCIIAFTLGISLANSTLQKSNVVGVNFCFSLASPVGIILGILVTDLVQGLPMVITSGILQGLAAGTFLYVTLFEILPEELKSGRDRMVKVACIVLGYSVVSILLTFLPE
ncbi:unnamed protein product [Larinioides sclopetarius]|uniref:Zinc transporter ZIP1 n=1 Tax=Larinioides sclopetarius TaxID=280406 RepID=A0AAV2AHU2_9ARAC